MASHVFSVLDPKDLDKAFKAFEASAKRGWSEAEFNLGICYTKGIGIKADMDKAKEWFGKAKLWGINPELSKAVEDKATDFMNHPDHFNNESWVRNWSDLNI